MLLHDAGSTPCSNLFDGVVQTGHHGLAIAKEHHGLVHVEEVVVNTGVAYREGALDDDHRLRLIGVDDGHACKGLRPCVRQGCTCRWHQ